MPNDLGDELGNSEGDIRVRRGPKQPDDEGRSQHLPMPNTLIERWGWLISQADRGQPGEIVSDILVGCVGTAWGSWP